MRVEEVRDKTVADIGSGTGRLVRMLAAAGARRIVAVEPSEAMAVLRRNTADIADRTEYVHARGEDLPGQETLDLVLSVGVLHHVPDPRPIVRRAYEALRPGGRMLIWLYGREGNGTLPRARAAAARAHTEAPPRRAGGPVPGARRSPGRVHAPVRPAAAAAARLHEPAPRPPLARGPAAHHLRSAQPRLGPVLHPGRGRGASLRRGLRRRARPPPSRLQLDRGRDPTSKRERSGSFRKQGPGMTTRVGKGALLVGLCLASVRCADARRPPDVVLISIDCLNHRQLEESLAKGRVPQLARLAQDSLVFQRGYAHAPWTTPSHMSMLTGLYPSQHGRDIPYGLMFHFRGATIAFPSTARFPSGWRPRGTSRWPSSARGSISRVFGLGQGFSAYNEADRNNSEGSDLPLNLSRAQGVDGDAADEAVLPLPSHLRAAPAALSCALPVSPSRRLRGRPPRGACSRSSGSGACTTRR